MIRSYVLVVTLSLCCVVPVSGMNQEPDNPVYNFITQKVRLPAALVAETGAPETIIRDALRGGVIVPSLIATGMFALFANHQEGPCNRYCAEGVITVRCFGHFLVGSLCVFGAIMLKSLGHLFDVANNNPTAQAVVWRNRCRWLYGIATVCALLNSDYLVEKNIL